MLPAGYSARGLRADSTRYSLMNGQYVAGCAGENYALPLGLKLYQSLEAVPPVPNCQLSSTASSALAVTLVCRSQSSRVQGRLSQ